MTWDRFDEDQIRENVDEEAAPDLNLPSAWILLVLATAVALAIVGGRCFGADIKHFGAVGDGVADDTAAIVAAVADCESKRRAFKPQNGAWIGVQPELYFPAGRYKISSPIALGPYQNVRGEEATIEQLSDCPAFQFLNCYRNRVSGLQFVGGSRQIDFSNANTDETRLTVRDCTFEAWNDVAIVAVGTGPDFHMSAILTIEDCVFDGVQMLRTHCDSTFVRDTRHQFRTDEDGSYSMELNWGNGILSLNGFTGTPEAGDSLAHWITNRGSTIARDCRFGGENGGIPIIKDYGELGSRRIVIESSQVCCGKDGVPCPPQTGLITLFGVPQCIAVRNCQGIVLTKAAGNRLVMVGPGFDLASKVALIPPIGLQQYSITFAGNGFIGDNGPNSFPAPLRKFLKWSETAD